MPLPVLSLSPYLTPRPWGGLHLPVLYGQETTTEQPIGEAWSLSDRPEGPAYVSGGPLDGILFGEVIRSFPKEAIGQPLAPKEYPLLVKYIDAAEDLSIQVHPDDAYTQMKGLPDRGKTECWYIMDCQPGAEIIYGLAEGVTRTVLQEAIAGNHVADVVRRIPISPGTFLFVPPGTVHAILGGTLLCEIQQSSNLTYRLWDWDRKPPRQIHIEESLDVIRYDPTGQPEPVILGPYPVSAAESILLTSNKFFEVSALRMPPGSQSVIYQTGKGFILNGVEGECTVSTLEQESLHVLENGAGTRRDSRSSDQLPLGGTIFVPACIPEVVLRARDKNTTVLVSTSLA